MSTTWVCGTTLILSIVTRVYADQPGVTVYLTNINMADAATLVRAKNVAGQILESAGVTIQWKVGPPRHNVREEILQIEFLESAPVRFAPAAMAYATPYRQDGTCIHVFYYRVLHMRSRQLAPVLLGHVMAHEIAHVLEAEARHSNTGVMKSVWETTDYDAMSRQPLRFAPEDIDLILRHWVAKAAPMPAVSNSLARQPRD